MELRLSIDWAAVRAQIERATTPKFRAEVAERLADAAHDYWITLARDSLNTSRDLYVTQIGRPRRISPTTFELGFDGPLAQTAELIEFEHGSHQMRGGLPPVVAFRTQVSGVLHPGAQPLSQAFRTTVGPEAAGAIGSLLAKQIQKHGMGTKRISDVWAKKGVHAGPVFENRVKKSKQEFVTFRSTGGDQPSDRWVYPAGPGVQLLEKVREALPLMVGPITQQVYDEESARYPASWMRKI